MISLFFALSLGGGDAQAQAPARRPASSVRVYSRAPRPVPRTYGYRPYYTGWYAHPYYRHVYAPPRSRVVVSFGYATQPWSTSWAPPPRDGWVWVPGRRMPGGYWSPGYWRPRSTPPSGYTYVPGYWAGDTYVEGYYRATVRNGWTWVPGGYVAPGQYAPGTWRPLQAVPDGFVWEPGFYDGAQYVDGFWRPAARSGHRWIPATWAADGTRVSGYWQPLEARPGFVWVPGWFDGSGWVEGYWESASDYRRGTARPPAAPEEGELAPEVEGPEQPLALPVE